MAQASNPSSNASTISDMRKANDTEINGEENPFRAKNIKIAGVANDESRDTGWRTRVPVLPLGTDKEGGGNGGEGALGAGKIKEDGSKPMSEGFDERSLHLV
jgi:hypothetical protein